MTIPNVVVSAPSQLFTLPNSFAAIASGSIYIGQINTDPTVAVNQIQVYVQNDDGSTTAVTQPISIGAGGYPEYNGVVAKFVTMEGQSMAVLDANGVQQFYYPDVLKYDPDQFAVQLALPTGPAIGFQQTTADRVQELRAKSKQKATIQDFIDNSTGVDVGPFLSLAMYLGDASLGSGGTPISRTFNIASDVQLPGTVLRGLALNYGGFVFTAETAILRANSGTTIENLQIDAKTFGSTQQGALVATVVNGNPINRVVFDLIRINNGSGSGFYFNITQNSIIRGCFSNLSAKYGFYIAGAENCIFDHCNSQQASDSDPSARGIYIARGSNGTTLTRQVRFINGIYERGNCDYQVEIADDVSSVFFKEVEINGGSLASVKLSNQSGTVVFDNCIFTRNAPTGIAIDGAEAGPYIVKGLPAVSSLGGRVPSSLFSGTPIFDHWPWRPYIESDFSGGNIDVWSKYGSAPTTQFSFDDSTTSLYLSSQTYNQGMQCQPFIGGFEPSLGLMGRVVRLRIFCYSVVNVIRVLQLNGSTQLPLLYNGAQLNTTLVLGINEFIFDLNPQLIGFRFTSDNNGLLGEVHIKNIECVWM
jgi:hypothetical protein